MRVVVAGALAQRPSRGGHAWLLLQYLLGFAGLGHDVLFLDRLESEMCIDEDGLPCAVENSLNVRYLIDIVREFWSTDRFGVLVDGGRRSIGMDVERVADWVRSADLLVDVMGYLEIDKLLDLSGTKLFLDIDPGFTQMWCELGLADLLGKHDVYATFGVNIGQAGCPIPSCDIDWIPTRPPVVLDQWPVVARCDPVVTSVCTWRGPYAPIEFHGERYGLRAHELRKLAELPSSSVLPLELALDVDPSDHEDLELLSRCGWGLVDPIDVSADPSAYRSYIQRSAGELMVAKEMYVRSRSGWFSDRSACYLASGKPVVALDTGLGGHYPTGEGLLTFEDTEGASSAISALWDEYPRHAKAARALAETAFESGVVLRGLLEEVDAR